MAVALLDGAAADLHAGSEGAVFSGEFVGNDEDALEFLKAREVAVEIFDDALIQGLHLVVGDQVARAKRKTTWLAARPIFEQREVRERSGPPGICACRPATTASAIESVVFERVLDGLRRDEFAAGSLDQVLLPVGDGEKAVGVEVADVAGLEPAIDESVRTFLGPLPVSSGRRKDRGQGSPRRRRF